MLTSKPPNNPVTMMTTVTLTKILTATIMMTKKMFSLLRMMMRKKMTKRRIPMMTHSFNLKNLKNGMLSRRKMR